MAVAIGSLVLYGWSFRVDLAKSVLPGLVQMKANTALSLVLAGVSLWLLLPGETSRLRRRAAHVLASVVVLTAAATLGEYAFGVNLGIDQLLFREAAGAVATFSPGRMAPTTATALFAIALALLLLDWETRRGRRPAQVLALWALLIAMMAIAGYIYNATALYRLLLYTQVALHTAIALLFLSTAVFFARPRVGIAGHLTSDGSGGVMARRMLPAAFLVPLALGWVRLQGQHAGLYGTELGLALYATSNILVFAVLVWLSARHMNGLHEQRNDAELGLRELNVALEARVADRTQTLRLLTERLSLATAVGHIGVWERDMISGILTFDSTMFEIYGLPATGTISYERFALLVHPEDLPRVEASVQEAIEADQGAAIDFRIVRPDGSVRDVSAFMRAVSDEQGRLIRLVGVNLDVTDQKRAEEALRHSEARMARAAEHDFLTDLPNRMLLNDRLRQAIALARRQKSKVAVLFLDLDGFKHINDSLGHPVGDGLLLSVAKRLISCVRDADTVSRQGGDEFVVLLSKVEKAEDAAITARRMLGAVAQAHSIDQHELHVTASIGVSVYPDDAQDAETLIKNADTAMYQAKENGRHGVQFFTPAMNVRAVERHSIEEGLRRALERREFTLHYQPKIDLRTGVITGAEALIRWMHPVRGLIDPIHFIPVAEECGLIVPIGNWVLREACGQARAWVGPGAPWGTMAVNISAVEFRDQEFVAGVFAILAETGLDPRLLELELTESVLMKDPESTAKFLQTLRKSGVQIAVDDFGTGYSSLSYLQKFQIDALKIDQSFVRQITTSPDETNIVTAVISMGRNLGLRVSAEGVETSDELAFLQAHHCDEGQGYYFSRPLPAFEFARLLEAGVDSAFLRGHAVA